MTSASSARDQAAKARAELADTLDAIEDKLNVPKRAAELTGRAKAAYERNPLPFLIGGAAVALLTVGSIAWAIISSGDDD